MLKPIFLLCLLVVATGFAAMQTPRATHRVVRVTAPDAHRPAEVSIAINPTNPANLLATSIQYNKNPQPGAWRITGHVYSSRDGGQSWQTYVTPNPLALTQGDDSITFGADGAAYHCFIAFDGIRTERPKRAHNGIQIIASRDGGQSWEERVAVIDHLNTVRPFEDKPYVVTDNVAGSPHKGNVYLAWTRFDVYGSKRPEDRSHIFFSKSVDGGKSYAPPFRISDKPGDCLDGDGTVEGAIVAAGLKGEIYVVWGGPEGLVFDQSTDGGWTFGQDKVIAATPGGWDIEIAGLGRSNGMPVTKVDHSPSAHRGTIYVNWVDERNGDPDVFLIASRDGGATWSAPLRINDDKLSNGKAQFLTWMAVDSLDGSVNIVFYDRRGLDGTKTGVTLARSVDGGRTFVNYKIDQPPFECNDKVFFGDYNGIDAFNGLVIPIWTHFISQEQLAVSAALFKFKPGTQETLGQ